MGREKLQESIEILRRYYNRIDGVVFFMLFILVLLMVFVSIMARPAPAALMVALACSLTGALLGFLFAVPRRVREAAAGAAAGAGALAGSATAGEAMAGATVTADSPIIVDGRYDSNTSLEEISDWLTKIIVGVGLVEAQSLAEAIGRAGRAVGTGAFGHVAGTPAGEVVGVSTIVAFAVVGFMASFLWFRQNLMIAWSQSHPQMRPVPKQRLDSAPPERVQSAAPPPEPSEMPETLAVGPGAEEGGGKSESGLTKRIDEKYLELRTSPKDPEDWVKGMFGGLATRRSPSRALTAKLRPVRNDQHYEVVLTVTSQPPARGQVAFFLHNTFEPAIQLVDCDSKGTAVLTIYAWGAFTVGVLMDDGRTELELDLSQLAGAPRRFKES